MKSFGLFLTVILLAGTVAHAVENIESLLSSEVSAGTLKGSVIDEKTLDPLQGANISIEGTQRGTTAEADGIFIISDLPAGTYNIIITFIGYTDKRLDNLKVNEGEILDLAVILMAEEAITLEAIVVTPGSFAIMGEGPISRQTLGSEELKNMSFAEDITRAVTRLPGVSSNDYSSKFAVRGGEADEVLMTLDGMELYEPFHQRDFAGGLFSLVDIETIQGIDLLTGGFSSEFGNRQSAVFNMRTKQIEDGGRHTSTGLSIMQARIYTDGTFAQNKGNYILSARRGMLDQTFKLIGQEEITPVFYDMMGKVEYKLSPKNVLSFHALQAGDKTAVRDIKPEAYDIYDTDYGNTYAWLTLKSFYNKELFSRSLLYAGLISHNRYGDAKKYELADKTLFSLSDERSFNFFGVKQDWDWMVSERLYLKSGFDFKQLNADYKYFFSINDLRINSSDSLFYYSDLNDIHTKPTGQQASAYISARFPLLEKLFIESGLRYDYASYTNDNLWSPRASFAYAFSKTTFLRGAWGYYYQTQFINNLDVNHNHSKFNPAELSKHYVVGFEHLFDNGISIRLDGYYKDISRISTTYQNLRDPWEVFSETRNDVVELDFNGAAAKGIELFLKYDMGKRISWWFSYSLAKAEEDIRSLEFDGLLIKRTGTLPRINNQLHTIYCDLNYRPNNKWHFNLSWQFYEGWPLTTYTYNSKTLDNGDLHFYQIHNEFRAEQYPAYHRMDLRVNRHFYFNFGRISTFLHIINLYNRENLRKFDLDVDPDGQGGYKIVEDHLYWFGLTPVLGVSCEF